jgi:FkbM family methyltransferase
VNRRWQSVIKRDEHLEDMRLLLSALPNGLARRGVVQVGAHKGEEVGVFREYGFKSVTLIEANPPRAEEMRRAFASDQEIRVIELAIGDTNGEASFYLHTSRSGSTEPASLLPMAVFKEVVPTLYTASELRVRVVTLDSLVDEAIVSPDRCNLLVVDVQGGEGALFRGAQASVRRFDAIITEVNVVPLYEGGLLEEELIAMLEDNGFEPLKAVYHELYQGDHRFVAWGECLLVRKD